MFAMCSHGVLNVFYVLRNKCFEMFHLKCAIYIKFFRYITCTTSVVCLQLPLVHSALK